MMRDRESLRQTDMSGYSQQVFREKRNQTSVAGKKKEKETALEYLLCPWPWHLLRPSEGRAFSSAPKVIKSHLFQTNAKQESKII